VDARPILGMSEMNDKVLRIMAAHRDIVHNQIEPLK
jgi:hypothetical protein